MCYHYNLESTKRLKELYPANYNNYKLPFEANGFAHPKMPIITSNQKSKINFFNWGLLNAEIDNQETALKMRKNCLNARIETISEKWSYKESIKNNQKCIVPFTSFFEWQEVGEKKKKKWKIEHSYDEIIYFAGIWQVNTKIDVNNPIYSFSILTCKADEMMSLIHNTKKRMPVILSKRDEILEYFNEPINIDKIVEITHNQEIEADWATID